MTTTDRPMQGNQSELPPIAKIAKEIREGSTVDAVCKAYRVSKSTLAARFKMAGYTLSTGEPHAQHERPAPLESAHHGHGGQHVGGGDYQGLPTKPVRYSGKSRRNGIDWDAISASYAAHGGESDPSVWPGYSGPVVIVGGSANSSRANIHTFVESDEYDEPKAPAPRPKRAKRPANPGSGQPRKLTAEQRAQLGRRYHFGEGLLELSKAYDVSVTTVTNVLKELGVPTRSNGRPAKVRTEGVAS